MPCSLTERAAGPEDAITADLHCHSAASFDSTVEVLALVDRAARRGVTHLAITDHGTIDGALQAQDAARCDVSVIVGEEIRTTDGDVIALFIRHAIPDGLPLHETIAAIREQEGLVGLPHPFDRRRPSVGRRLDEEAMGRLAAMIDYVEIDNGRLAHEIDRWTALVYAARHGLPGVDASDAHTLVEVGTVVTRLQGRPTSTSDLRTLLAARVAETGDRYRREASERHGGVGAAIRRLARRARR